MLTSETVVSPPWPSTTYPPIRTIWSRNAAAEAARRPATPGTARTSVHLPVVRSIAKAWLLIASQVFFGPMPMKEKILDSLPAWVMTTALLETATGRGLSLGSSAAWRVAARKKNSSAGDGFFIDEILAAGTGIGTEVKPSVRDTENTD